MTTNSKNDDLYLGSVFGYNKPTEYNTFFGRYLVTLMNVDGKIGDMGFIDTDVHPMVYNHITVTANVDSGKVAVEIYSWKQTKEGLPIQIPFASDIYSADTASGCLIRGFCDYVFSTVDSGNGYQNVTVIPGEDNTVVIGPAINVVNAAVFHWMEKSDVEMLKQSDLYFPIFKVYKEQGFFSYSKGIPGEQEVDFSDINEFMNSEYYLTGDDIAPFVRLQQKECLLEVERQLMGTIN